MDRELDARVAAAMGWSEIHADEDVGLVGYRPKDDPLGSHKDGSYVYRPENFQGNLCHGESFPYWRVPLYKTRFAAAWQAVELMISRGGCPALIYDDNGHWALAEDGWQMVPLGDEPQTIATTFLIEAEDWQDTPMLAICHTVLKWAEAQPSATDKEG